MCIEITKRLAGGPVTITDLGVAANLNFAKTREVLGVLLKSGIVEQTTEEGRAKEYGLTRKGYEFVERWEDALRMLNGNSAANVSIPNPG